MNSIETLPLSIERNEKVYNPCVYVTAWNKLCVSYNNISDRTDKYCSVVVEKNKPAIAPCFDNCNIGDAPTLDEAVEMIRDFILNN